VVPELWERFIPHFTRPGKISGRVIAMPDQGMNLDLGSIKLKALPAHFLHAEGNFQFYDPVSRILFSGDLGANLCPEADLDKPVTRLSDILPYMEGFHRRYMNGNKACRFWAQMVRDLEISPRRTTGFPDPGSGRPSSGRQRRSLRRRRSGPAAASPSRCGR